MNAGFGQDPIAGLDRLSPDHTRLQLRNGPRAKQEFSLHRPSQIVGRNIAHYPPVEIDLSDCELGNPPMISRQHALLEWIDGSLQLCDLNSRNGSWVNGQKLIPTEPGKPSSFVPLRIGSFITLGNLEFEVINHD